jgi:hypothetical protein
MSTSTFTGGGGGGAKDTRSSNSIITTFIDSAMTISIGNLFFFFTSSPSKIKNRLTAARNPPCLQ